MESDQAKVSAIMNGKLIGYTYDGLVRFLKKLNGDVTIVITSPTTAASGRVVVETE